MKPQIIAPKPRQNLTLEYFSGTFLSLITFSVPDIKGCDSPTTIDCGEMSVRLFSPLLLSLNWDITHYSMGPQANHKVSLYLALYLAAVAGRLGWNTIQQCTPGLAPLQRLQDAEGEDTGAVAPSSCAV